MRAGQVFVFVWEKHPVQHFWMNICMHACMHSMVCTGASMSAVPGACTIHAYVFCMYTFLCACMYPCIVFMYVGVCARVLVKMHACIHACVYLFLSACSY